ncbi:hypothetical protein M405DRAFT_845626, partial [Rhizopogon salebrosus TDB-379]
MLDAESNAEEDAEDLDAPLLLTKKARQSAVGLDDDEDELARLMQDDLDDAEHQDEEDACKAHTMDDMLIEGDKDDTPPPCTQPRSKDLSTSSIVASSRSSTPLSELGALSKKERGYLHNLPDKAGIIAAMGHRILRIHVAMVDGFPSTTSKDDVSTVAQVLDSSALTIPLRGIYDVRGSDSKDVSKEKRPLSEVMVKTKQEGLREIVVQVRRKETVQWLPQHNESEITKDKKATRRVSSTTKISQTIQWMLKTDAFIYDKLDIELARCETKTAIAIKLGPHRLSEAKPAPTTHGYHICKPSVESTRATGEAIVVKKHRGVKDGHVKITQSHSGRYSGGDSAECWPPFDTVDEALRLWVKQPILNVDVRGVRDILDGLVHAFIHNGDQEEAQDSQHVRLE